MSRIVPQEYCTREWIKPQMDVILTKNLGKKDPPVLVVDRLIKKSIAVKGKEERRTLVVGVMVHWTIPREGLPDKYERGRFGTKELFPFEVFKLGTAAIVEWSEMQTKKHERNGTAYRPRN